MKINIYIFIVLFSFSIFAQKTKYLDSSLASTPPMGWSSWNTFKKNPTEEVIKQIADAMVNTGLKDAGYTYVNIDDFWSPGRDENGQIIVDTIKFPNGMKFLADYIHSKGLKAGIYTNIGLKANYETLASGSYYQQDIQAFADWNYDYVKVDVNFAPIRTEEYYKKEFTTIYNAIKKTGKPIFFNICNQGGGSYQNWAPSIANSWRVGGDIDHMPKGAKTQWEGFIYELDQSSRFPEIAGPGHWNDADMMLVGVGDDGGRLVVMSNEEQKSHFSMWCMIASPLILGNDLRSISKETLDIILNKEAIAINQDPLGIQGKLIYEQSNGLQVWIKKLKSTKNKKYAVALFNRTDSEAKITLDFSKAKLHRKIKIRDVWKHQDLGKFVNTYSKRIPSHGIQMLIIE